MVINKKGSKTYKVCVLQVIFCFVKICWNSFYFFTYDSITSSIAITESSIILAKYFSFWQIHVLGFQTYSFSNIWCLWQSHWHLSFFHHWFDLNFFLSSLHLYLHEICFANVFDSFIPVMMLKTLRFKISVLFEIHSLLDKSVRVL